MSAFHYPIHRITVHLPLSQKINHNLCWSFDNGSPKWRWWIFSSNAISKQFKQISLTCRQLFGWPVSSIFLSIVVTSYWLPQKKSMSHFFVGTDFPSWCWFVRLPFLALLTNNMDCWDVLHWFHNPHNGNWSHLDSLRPGIGESPKWEGKSNPNIKSWFLLESNTFDQKLEGRMYRDL